MHKVAFRSLRVSAALVFLAAASAMTARATWYGENVARGADLMMMDIRYPWWAESTYNAHWNFSLDGPHSFSGYGGFTMGVRASEADHRPNLDPDIQSAFRPGSVWSFWGVNADGEPPRVVATSEFNYPRQYVGEGATCSLGGPVWPMIKAMRWYTMMVRVWQPVGATDPKVSYMGRWVKDVGSNHWYLYGIVQIPSAAKSFHGNAGFLEDFGNGGRSVRSLHRRLGYYRKDGMWGKSDTVTYEVPPRDTCWVVEQLENETVLGMELSSNPALLPQKLKGQILAPGKHAFTVKQPDQPTLDRPALEQVTAAANGKQVLVSWAVPVSASPQLYYKVEVFDNAACSGTPLAVREARMPTTRTVLLPAEVAQPTVRVSIADVFDQPSPPVVVKAGILPSPSAAVARQNAPGLEYELLFKGADRHVNVFYPTSSKAEWSQREKHYWLALDEMKEGRLVQQGVTHGFNTELRGDRNQGYAFRFRGLLRVPVSGLYLFHVKGADGYLITLDGQNALTWDGLHGPEEKTFSLGLSQGDHPLSIDYFVDTQLPSFSLEWESLGLPRAEIPKTALLHEDSGLTPIPTMSLKSGDQGRTAVSVKVTPHGRKIDRIDLFLGKMLVESSASNMLDFNGLLPAGTQQLWSRVWFDGNHTVDSDFIPVTSPSVELADWRLGVAGEAKANRNLVQPAPDAFTFVGEGEYVLYRPIKGDFTLTCRVDACLGLNGEPVNPMSWVGLSVRENAARNNYGWGREFALIQTARHGLRTTPDFSDGGGQRVSNQILPVGHTWLRIVRQGSLWTAWTSGDGISWQCGAIHYRPLKEELDAGIVFRAPPQDARMYFRAAVSKVSLVAGVPNDFEIPHAQPASGTALADLTGIAVAPSNSQIVVARSSTRGLLRSTDGGATWKPANGACQGAANAVRSVAIHPTNPEIMLRATGRGHEPEGGLYLTRDGGNTWEKLTCRADFDGTGPSALCGEIIAFHSQKPEIILVGAETKGLFRSEDGGVSWTIVLPAGERFTAVKFHPRDINAAGEGVAHAVTCTDHLLPLLGRGLAALSTTALNSRDYLSGNSGRNFTLQSERSDLGFLNFTYGDPSHATLEYATTSGLLHSFSAGRETCLMWSKLALEAFRPITALAAGQVENQVWDRIYAQALTPETFGRVSRCDYARDMHWGWQAYLKEATQGVIAIAPCDLPPAASGNRWWFLCPDGLYQFDNNRESFTRMLK